MEIPAGYAQVNLRFEGTALPTGAEVTFGIDLDGYAGSGSDLADDIATLWDTSNMNGLMVAQTALTQTSVKYGPTATGPTYESTIVVQGSSAGSAVPPNTSLLVTKVTLFGGRAGRGRFFVPAINEAEVDLAGNLSSAMIGFANGVVDGFHDGLVNQGTPMVVLHNPGGPLVAPSVVQDLVVSNRVATQRRRLRR